MNRPYRNLKNDDLSELRWQKLDEASELQQVIDDSTEPPLPELIKQAARDTLRKVETERKKIEAEMRRRGDDPILLE